MTFNEILGLAKSGEKPAEKYSALEQRTYSGIRLIMDMRHGGYIPEGQALQLYKDIKGEYEETVRLHGKYMDGIRSWRAALSSSDALVAGIVKSVAAGDRDYERLFFRALGAYEAMTGDTASAAAVKRYINGG